VVHQTLRLIEPTGARERPGLLDDALPLGIGHAAMIPAIGLSGDAAF